MKNPTQIASINNGRACITAATKAVTSTATHLERRSATTLSCFSAYILFVSTLTLLIATMFINDMQHEIDRTVGKAINILQHTMYGGTHSRAAQLEFIQVGFDPLLFNLAG